MKKLTSYGIGPYNYSVVYMNNVYHILRQSKKGGETVILDNEFQNPEDALNWCKNVLFHAWLQWNSCNKVVGGVYLQESQLRAIIRESIKKILRVYE